MTTNSSRAGRRLIYKRSLARYAAMPVLLLAALFASASIAQSAEGAPAEAVQTAEAREYSIPSQALSQALLRFSEQSGIQLFFDAPMAEGLTSSAVSGRYEAVQAIGLLLSGTGLSYRFVKPNVITLEKPPAGARVLGPVRVQGAEIKGVAGINGSTDPTATEGTKSYTSSALSIASKMPQSIKDTPQSVSVITQQRLQDQNLTDFTAVMSQATGITLVTNNSLASTFYSRGFAVDSLQIDGGAPLTTKVGGNSVGYFPQIDMAQYDHVEILRGADGLFNGYGTPSGSVNLARKRPLDHAQVVVEGQYGSWENYRTVLDATAPLGFDGKLRGRAVMSYQDQDYFYNTASSNKTLTYGVIEADLTPSTVLSGGFSFTRQDSLPWFNGLPRYDDGTDLKLPRSTSFALVWNRWNFETKEIFAQFEQHFGEDWAFKLNLTRNDQESSRKYGYATGTVNPVTAEGSSLRGSMSDYASLQTLVDFNVNGAFDLFGHRQQIVFGGNWQDADGGGLNGYSSLYTSPYTNVDVFSFDPADPVYREPMAPNHSSHYPKFGQKQWGAYATLRLTLWEPLHLIAGLRYSDYEYSSENESLCSAEYVVTGYRGCTAVGQVYSSSKVTYRDHSISWPPTLSLVYDLRQNWSAYASYSDIYRSQGTSVGRDRKPIDPITGSNIEAGLKIEGFAGKLNASIAAYRIEQENEAVYDGQFIDLGEGVYCCYRNGNQVDLSRGVDAEVTGELLPGWQLSVGYTYNLNQIKGSDYYDSNYGEGYSGPILPLVSLVPKHLLKLWTSYQFQSGGYLRRLNIGGGVNAQTASYNSGTACTAYSYETDDSGNETANCSNTVAYDYTQGFYAVFSSRIAYQIDPYWNAALNLNNITDRSYYQTMGDSTSGNWYGEPRSFMLTLRGTF